MGTVIMIAQLILALAILVSLHEWGHYIAARSFGIRVEKFFIFFDAWGIKLFSKKVNDTEWGIGWLPLGGYVKIAGMIDESLDKEQLKTEPKEDEFRGKPAWQRLIVMLGGVTVNFVLGILIFSMMLFYFGDKYLPNSAVVDGNGIMVTEIGAQTGLQSGDRITKVNGNEVLKFRDLRDPAYLLADELNYEVLRDGETLNIPIDDSIRKQLLESKGQPLFEYRFSPYVGQVVKKSNAHQAGLKVKDRITAVAGTEIQFFDELKPILQEHKEKSVAMQIDRDGETINLDVMVDSNGTIGFRPTDQMDYLDQQDTVYYNFFASFPEGTKRGINTLAIQIKAFGQMFSGKIDPTKSVMGPIQMTKLFGAVWDWERFWQITGLLSLILAFMNLLPIPALDGGHVLFLLVEMAIGRALPEKFMYVMQVIGMIILFGLMAFIFGVDILSFFK
ncbi:MAG: RIP metalloprotease RseP [Bacteroidia bacterium]